MSGQGLRRSFDTVRRRVRARQAPAVARLRLLQIRGASNLVRAFSRSSWGASAVQAFARGRRSAPIYRAVMGFSRPFASLDAAAAACAAHAGGGHTSADYFRLTWTTTERVRLSDYPVLFHLQTVLPAVRRVFDLGGHVGNMFYCYAQLLPMPADLVWTVCDLPEVAEAGRRMALEKAEPRLQFTDDLRRAEECDFLLASGSAHYFERPLSHILRALSRHPPFVLINRSPMLASGMIAAVQDGGSYRIPCVLHDRSRLIADFAAMGYRLVDHWAAPEHHLAIAGFPQYSVSAYSGLFFADDQAGDRTVRPP
jgi:putative methyltransferase (TIGR04325 family)